MEEFKATLTSIERKLCDRLILEDIIGKRGRKVPVLITPELQTSIDTLIKHRSAAGIQITHLCLHVASATRPDILGVLTV
jgi:hypothetical protein